MNNHGHTEHLGMQAAANALPEVAVPDRILDWQPGQAQLSQGDRALNAVAPDEMNVTYRAGHLINALDRISDANQAAGFTKAVRSAVHAPGIQRRYGPHTAGVAAGTASRQEFQMKEARAEFMRASGLGRLATAPNLNNTERVAHRAMEDQWQRFLRIYGGTGEQNQVRRRVFRAKLDAQRPPRSEDDNE